MHQPHETFSDRFALRENALTRLDARVKLLLALAAMAAAAWADNLLLPLAVFAVSMGALAAMRIPPRMLAWRLAGPLSVPLVVFLLRVLLGGGDGWRAVLVGPWPIATVPAGLAEGLLIGSRVLGSMSVLVLLGMATPAHKAFAALRWLGMPRLLVELLLMMYRYLFCLSRQVVDIGAAQRARLGYCGFGRSMRSAGTLAGMSLLRAMDQAQRTAEAMRARAYAGQLPLAESPRLRRADVLALACGLALLAGGALLCRGGSA